MIYYNNII